MKQLLTATILTLCLFMPLQANAQNEDLDIVDDPICFSVKNTANYTILGSFITDYYTRPDGIKTRHRSNFRLSPDSSEEYCTYGPFLPNRQLLLSLRTLFPVFECKTRIDMGEIVIKGARNKNDTGVITWAECFEGNGNKTGKPPE